ncbi:MAG: two-CW domain-containing protein [Candidatus Thorarchaeota archaeon]
MSKKNCWEFMNCGREPGGINVAELGECVAASASDVDGTNGGRNGGRLCWALAGTLCGGQVQGEYASKMDNCIMCDVYLTVSKDEGDFVMYPDSIPRENCWDFMQCGREEGGAKSAELGVCPAATNKSLDSLNRGTNGGRICWSIAGTLCGGEVQAEFATKIANCVTCAFYNKVLNEEQEFAMHPTI